MNQEIVQHPSRPARSRDAHSPFEALGLSPVIVRALREAGYERPTPIQEQAIGPALAGRDVLGCAQTGTGKTAAFTLPILEHLEARAGDQPSIRALILTPTRELAAQIGDSFARYGRHLELWHTVIFGGVGERAQIAELKRGVDTLIATPGRLLDLLGRKLVDLSGVEIFVLDEADRMLDMGFLPDVKRVVAALPTKRQTLFFSATMPPEIRGLAERLLRDPVEVSVARISAPAERIAQRVYFVDKADKRRLLVDLLRDASIERSLVFSRTKHGADRIAKLLASAGVKAAAIHGNKAQNARIRALDGFKQGDTRVLVATDIAARGIDVEGVTHVINFDLPNVAETYVHRIGRTARAGSSGIALSLCDGDERPHLASIERLIATHLERITDHAFPPSTPPPPATDLSGKPGRPASNNATRRSTARRPRRFRR
jgi:ATP-dependent RNA helicase RhlE